ncbi:MAG: TonB-dependent receptor plug domain-containing protein [Prevotellaceae bacterium]|nr:TonB-dependent receptor plug domain-containing protein [Prevotellaceae bacterium]
MKKTFLFLIFTGSFLLSYGQNADIDRAIDNFTTQLSVFPQEKIYIQSDKPYYLAGENMYFRIYLLNAQLNQPALFSRYVYVELINPLDSVVIRQQIRPEDLMFYGAITLPVSLPQGNYTLRAYTRYMENFEDRFFYTRSVFIASSNAIKFDLQTEFEYFDNEEIGLSLRFMDKTTKEIKRPDRIALRFNEKQALLKPDKDGWVNLKFKLNQAETKRVLTAGYGEEMRLFETYIHIPLQKNDDIDIRFYPEGGSIIENMPCKIAFKALLPNGNTTQIKGKIFNKKDEFVSEFETMHDGMGYFNLLAQKGEKYHAQCDYKGKTYRFDLPYIQSNTYSLKTSWNNGRLLVFVNKPADIIMQKMYLLIHSRGNLLYFDEWNFEQGSMLIDKNAFITGVQHFMLLTEDLQPVSERLVFVNKGDWTDVELTTNKNEFDKREYVKMDIQLSDTVKSNFSVSVTDDKDVIVDTTTNILAEILLSSELYGHVNNPAYYFENKDEETYKKADLLMLTQGWKRYNIPEILKGNIKTPKIAPEETQSISGYVTNNFSKPYRGAQVKIFSPDEGFFAETETDTKGNFVINDFEYPDSTKYVIQALTRKGKGSVLLNLNDVNYPKAKGLEIFTSEIKKNKKENTDILDYIENTDTKYSSDIAWVLNIEASIVTAKRIELKPSPKTYYGFEPDNAITQEDLERFPPFDIYDLLARLPGVIVRDKQVKILRSMRSSINSKNAGVPLFTVDGIPLSTPDENLAGYNISPIDDINVHEIEQINLIKSISKLIIYGREGSAGVIEIITKRGKYIEPPAKLNIKTVSPLGYQKPVEFYSPKYDTPEAIKNEKADIRSTIYWKPNVLANETGKATIDFYTADTPTTYSIVIEGVNDNGKLIYHRGKAVIEVK